MNRLASLRFDHVLADDERTEVMRALGSQAKLTFCSPQAGAGRTYALVSLPASAELAALPAALDARVDEPPLVVLAVVPYRRVHLGALVRALAGPGRPVGIIDARTVDEGLIVELDDTRTPLSLVVDAIDVELRDTPGRTIVPLLGLRDETLAAFAAATLAAPEIDRARLIETWVEPLLAAGAAP